MRKILVALMALVCLLLGCTKQCGFRFRSNDTPALKQGDYNSCEAINRNYCYLVCGSHSEVDYPYWANDGDTIMVCGYFYKDWHGDRNHFSLYDTPDNQYKFGIQVFEASRMLPEEIDISKKCYIKGRLSFFVLQNSFGSSIEPEINGVYDVRFE